MRYLIFISSLLAFTGCVSQYKSLQRIEGDVYAVNKFRPVFESTLYHTSIDVIGKHLSGLLLLKSMPDSSTRIVFTNEMGIKYFDFEFDNAGNFKVHFIIDQMNRKAVLSTLRNDFQLILMEHLDYFKAYLLKDDKSIYYVFPILDKLYFYISDPELKNLERIECRSHKKILVQATMENYTNGNPEKISITHCNFNFTIVLIRLQQ